MANTKVTSRVLANDAVLTANIADDQVTTAKIADDVALGGNPTTTTQTAGNNTTRIATTAFVTTAVANIVDSAPSALDTLNELAAALGDDANFSTTVTNSIAAKLPLSGGTMTGNLAMGSNNITSSGTITGTLATAAQPNITSVGTLTALTVDDITINGSTISDASHLTIDAEGVIKLDANGGEIQFLDGGTEIGVISMGSQNINIESKQADKDIVFKGIDGSSDVTALTLDMSDAGKAIFNNGIRLSADTQLDFGDDNRILKYTSDNIMTLQSAAHVVINIDNNANTSDAYFSIKKDTTNPASGGTELFRVQETGNMSVTGGITLSGLNGGDGLKFDMAGSGDYVIKESSTNDVMSFQGSLFHNFSNNRIGIGTASPDTTLEVKHNDNAGNRQGLVGDGATTGSALWTNWTTGSSYLDFRLGGTSSTYTKVRITSSGNLLVGTTSTLRSNKFHASSSNFVGGFNVTNGTGEAVAFFSNGTVVGTISVTGSATAYNTSSDARLKDVTGEARGLEVINALNPVSYNWKTDGKADEGLIAQEVLEVVPNAVNQDEDDYYMMDYSKLVTPLVKAIQEQQEQIETLKKEVEELKGG